MEQSSYLSIYEVVKSSQPSQIKLLLFLHSFDGRDTISYKTRHQHKRQLEAKTKVNISTLEGFCENERCEITKDLLNIAKEKPKIS